MSYSGEPEDFNMPLLDRLIDDDPRASAEQPISRSSFLERLRLAVSRDLQDLLNARIRWSLQSEMVNGSEDSLYNYGLPDFTAAGLNLAYDTGELKAAMLRAITTFEPRLNRVKIHSISDNWHVDRVYRFRIEAELVVEQQRVLIQFSSLLQPGTGQFSVGDG